MNLGLTTFFLLLSVSALAQTGARITALGSQSTAIQDNWNVLSNPAGIVTQQKFTISALHEAYGFDPEVSASALLIKYGKKNMSIALGSHRFGTTNYKELSFFGAYTVHFGRLGLGVGLQSQAISIPETHNLSSLNIRFGMQFQASSQWRLAAAVEQLQENLNNWSLGLSYEPFKYVLITTAWKNQHKYKPQLGLGLEYNITDNIAARIGLSNHPQTKSFGISYGWKYLKIHLALVNNTLGNKYLAELNYAH